MSETTYTKCACDYCGGHIEFPIEAAGQSVTCPHCSQLTALSTPPNKRRALKSFLLWAVVSLSVTLALVVVKSLLTGKPDSSLPVKIISFERAAANNPGAVNGVVENRAARRRQGVRVEIELLNARGELLWSTSAFAPAIEPNMTWQFRASVVDPNAVTARVANVRETVP